eukprot:23814-Eustigmatos_ZCMA.PRE.1
MPASPICSSSFSMYFEKLLNSSRLGLKTGQVVADMCLRRAGSTIELPSQPRLGCHYRSLRQIKLLF